MTREEAKREIDDIDFYLQHYTDDYGERSHDAMMMAIDALSNSQKLVLEQIRAEIEELETYYDNDYFSGNRDVMFKCNDVFDIIDKYKAERG